MKKKLFLTIEIDTHSLAALKFLGATRGVAAENIARHMIENCSVRSINEGPGGIAERHVEGAMLYEAGCPFTEWSPTPRGTLAKLKRCKEILKRIYTPRKPQTAISR